MHTLLQDLRYSLRQLIHSPGFALAAIVSLALGISATVAVFSVVWAVLMNPYPYAAPDRMAHMKIKDKDGQDRYFGLTGSQWQVIRHSPVVEDAFMTDGWNLTVTGRLCDVEHLPVSGCAAGAGSRPVAFRRDRRPRSAAGGSPELQVLAAALQWKSRCRGKDHTTGPQELHHRGGRRTALHLE
jgi:hypothetical protein